MLQRPMGAQDNRSKPANQCHCSWFEVDGKPCVVQATRKKRRCRISSRNHPSGRGLALQRWGCVSQHSTSISRHGPVEIKTRDMFILYSRFRRRVHVSHIFRLLFYLNGGIIQIVWKWRDHRRRNLKSFGRGADLFDLCFDFKRLHQDRSDV